MAQNNSHITADNVTEWMASTGFLFPRNELELARFEILYRDTVIDLTGYLIDPEVIVGRKQRSNVIALKPVPRDIPDMVPYKMVARKGGAVPQHILDKMKKNNQQRKDNDTGSQEEKPE